MQHSNQLECLHDELWENFENPLMSGFNQDEYYQIEDLVQQCLIELSIKLDQLQNKQAAVAETNMRSSLPLPKEFLAFLELQFQLMEVVEQKDKVAIKIKANRNNSVSSAVTVSKGNNNCKLCNVDRHPLYHCRKFLQFSPSQQLDWVKNQQLCFNCFRNDHVVNKCSSRSCTKCNKKHNTLLHLEVNNQTKQNIQPSSSGYNTAVTTATANTSTGHRDYVLLPTARVKIIASNGNTSEVRALLDSGSQVNIVSERLVKRLNISKTKSLLCIEGIGKLQKNSTQRVNIKLQSLNSRFTTEVEAFVLPNIVPPQPSCSYDISKWKVPNSIQLADPTFFQQGKIDILLGAEFYFSLLKKVFGGGAEVVDNNSSLEDAIEQLWRMDEVNTTERTLSKEEKLCESHFVQNVHTNKEGRFVVRLPFLENSLTLGESQETAWRRFISLERRLAKNDVLRKQYVQFMEEYERLGHMTEVNLDSMLTPRYFIPHHCVLKPDSTTTKLRVVFDASAKTTSVHSLNDLMRPRFVFTTDIEKMCRQVLINPEDRRYQLIIWRSSPNSTIRYYQLNTITYGTRASPYLATRCPQKIASENKGNYPLGAQILCDNFYVDDGLGGSDSLITAIEAQRQLIHILKKHQFYLRKWSANHPQLLKNISQDDQERQLHIFADASEKAFDAAAYVRAILKDGRIIVRLLCAKSRVAPLKKQTLPRLELCAAVLAAELSARVKSDLQEKDQPVFLWTDSEIVLSWINSQSSSFQTFVANRVARIQTLTLSEQWRHVRSKDNPADVLSRGLSARALSTCALWFQGPFFLHGRQEVWPPRFSSSLQVPVDLEKKKVVAVATQSNDADFIYRIQHKNSFKTLQKIVAYVLRFTNNARKSKESRATHIVLSANELDAALITIICHIQGNDFHEEIKQLKKQGHVDKSSSISSLSPFIDNANVLRVGGRLEASSLPYDSKHPMLFPYNDPLAKLLFVMFHEENKHCGPQALLSTVRQRFWPIKGKSTARATVERCIRCNKARTQLCQQIMGNLPESRITPARPFINAGVDYCGPFWIHYKVRGKKPTKAYIAVFCCFFTKAVHLELVTDLSTNAFIGALKRFISRRGRCLNIYSDNATNFVGAKNQLAELEESIYSNEGQEAIISACSTTGINFHFIPPRGPHFGGLWESSVKSAKYLLLRSVSTASLTYEELETVVVEIEAILNSRPLTPMSNDPTDLTALTPGHLLIGEALTTHVDSRSKPEKHTLLSRWNLVSQLKHNFWKRWSNEYLMELQQRNKWKTQSANIQLGDMDIIKEDNVPVMQWPLGRIVHVYKGTDGRIRVADVKTSTGIFKRPIHRIAVLPVNADDQPTMAEADHEVPPDNLIMKDRIY
ncbi:uncharacterized protein LOC119665804 [Teleopsis dalmanni]|uniref:uncharacterized protein LOC119665804 n=1 Tax=Teleopsis dalmanni TaxID=139649 RepID=UPI0018CFBF4C|nr:uncharacterized protein LOC119665804 [Teleopsis dalmanni]